jgi:hypothetical protein
MKTIKYTKSSQSLPVFELKTVKVYAHHKLISKFILINLALESLLQSLATLYLQ